MSDRLPQPIIRLGDIHSRADQVALLRLLDQYASQLPGRQATLPMAVRAALIPALQTQPGLQWFLAELAEHAVGLAICFDGFSTFRAKRLLNIHDLAVHADHRGRGIGSLLLAAVIEHARQADYCAVTLEVQASNPARQLYMRHGFQQLDGHCAEELMLFGKLDLG